MEPFSTRCIDECGVLNEKEVRGCGFLDSVLGPEIKQVLTAGVWLSPVPAAVVVFHHLTREYTSPGKSPPRLWKLYRLLPSAPTPTPNPRLPIAFIVFKKCGSPSLVIKEYCGENK